MQNTFFEKPEFWQLTSDQKVAWLYLLCMASKQNSAELIIHRKHFETMSGVKIGSMIGLVDILQQYQILLADVPPMSRGRALHTNIHTGQTLQTEAVASSTTAEASLQTLDGCHHELKGDGESEKFLQLVRVNTQTRWLKLFPADYIKPEVIKALNWLENNPQKRPRSPRGLSSFMSRWLNNGFERWRKQLPTNAKTGSQKVKEMMNDSD